MDLLLLEEEFADYIDAVNDLLERCDPGMKELLYLNRGHAEYKLGLGRKAVMSAERALSLNSRCLKACVLKAKALRLMGNASKVTIALKEAEDLIKGGGMGAVSDSSTIEEFRELLTSSTESGSGADPPSTSIPDSQPQYLSVPPPVREAKLPENRKPPLPPAYDVEKARGAREEDTIDFDFDPEDLNEKRNSVPRSMLQSVFEGLMRNFGQSIDTDVLLQARGSLAHASGDDLVDSLIALGYLQVNTGNLDMACEIFQLLLGYKSSLTACHMAVGSIRAMQRNYGAAVVGFDAAIDLCPDSFDAWKRRGQTKAAMGHPQEGLDDLEKSRQLFTAELRTGKGSLQNPDYAREEQADIAYQLGLVCHQMKDFRKACAHFMDAKKSGLMTPHLLNFLGMCEGQLGHVDASLAYHSECRSVTPAFKECVLNMAQMLKEQGNFEKSEVLFTEAIKLYLAQKETSGSSSLTCDDGANICDPSSSKSHEESLGTAYRYRAQLYYGIGDRQAALKDFKAALNALSIAKSSESSRAAERETRLLYGVALQAVGEFRLAIEAFDEVLQGDENSYSFFLREIAIHMAQLMGEPLAFSRLSSSSPDASIPPEVKLGSCKKLSRGMLLIESGMDVQARDSKVALARLSQLTTQHGGLSREVAARLLRAVSTVGKAVFLDCPGFLRNNVQARQFGLAVLCASTSIQREAKALVSSDGDDVRGAWRRVLDQVVRWRQLSEPMDPVWWIDGMPSRDFTEGFGLQTPIVNGQLSTVRYSCYFDQAFSIMKRIMAEKGYYDGVGEQLLAITSLSGPQVDKVRGASTLDDLYAVAGVDFFVIVPCTLSDSKEPEEGTRITLIKDDSPPGYQFTIRTPGTPDRWKAFDKEMTGQFQAAIAAITSRGGVADSSDSPDTVLKAALSVFYYWVIFGPLSRGSAATGYVILHAILAAAGLSVSEEAGTGLPRGKQLDWEAILAPSKEAFLQLALSWYLPVVGKAPHITEASLEECTCCSNTCSEEDPWGAWGESEQRPGAGWGLDNGFVGSWRWAGMHTGDLQQVKTPLDMLKLLNFSD